jgi:hypothetical protein
MHADVFFVFLCNLINKKLHCSVILLTLLVIIGASFLLENIFICHNSTFAD